MDNALCSYSHLAPAAPNYPHIILSSDSAESTCQTYCVLHTSNLPLKYISFCPTLIFDGDLANLSSFPRYNSFSMWPLKLFENSIQLHRIENWLKSWRPGESGRDSYIYDCPPPPLSNRQTRRIAKHEF